MPKLKNEITYFMPEELLEAIYRGSNFSLSETSYLDSMLQSQSRSRYHERNKKEQESNFPQGRTIITISPELLSNPLKKGNHPNHEPHSLVWHAIACGNKYALGIILTTDQRMGNFCAEFDEHPIVQAAAMQSDDMVKILLQHGADVSLACNPKDIELLSRLLHGNKANSHDTRNVGVVVLAISKMQRNTKLAEKISAKLIAAGCYDKKQLDGYLSKGATLPFPNGSIQQSPRRSSR